MDPQTLRTNEPTNPQTNRPKDPQNHEITDSWTDIPMDSPTDTCTQGVTVPHDTDKLTYSQTQGTHGPKDPRTTFEALGPMGPGPKALEREVYARIQAGSSTLGGVGGPGSQLIWYSGCSGRGWQPTGD